MKRFFIPILLVVLSINMYSETIQLAFKCVNKNYIAVDDDDGKATSSTIGRSETFEVEFIKPNIITIKARTNKYLCADQNFFSKASLRFNRDKAGEWEEFEIHPVNSSQVYIKSYNDYYLELRDNAVNFWDTKPNGNCLFSLCNTDGTLYNHNLPIPKTNNIIIQNTVGKRLYKKGEIITLKAPENSLFTEKDYGKGYDEYFKEVDKFDFQKDIDKDIKRFEFKYEKITEDFSKNWGINILGIGLSESKNTSERSLTYSYNYFNKTEGIHIKQDKLSFAKIVLVGITYGWSLDYRFTGSYYSLSKSACLDIPTVGAFSTVLKQLSQSNQNKAELSNQLERQKIKFDFKMNGFELKDTNKIPIAFEENDRFLSQFKPKNIPIYYHFQVYDDFVSDKIEWKAPVIEKGIYKIETIEFTIKKTDRDGSKWDEGHNQPDEVILRNSNGVVIGTCDWKGKETFYLALNKQIDTRSNQGIYFDVYDEDQDFFEDGKDDYIGRIYFIPSALVGKSYPQCEINYNYDKGQIVDKIILSFEEK